MILVEDCSPQRFYAVTERDPAARDLKSAEMFSGGGRIHTERNEIGFDRVEEIGETAEDPRAASVSSGVTARHSCSRS